MDKYILLLYALIQQYSNPIPDPISVLRLYNLTESYPGSSGVFFASVLAYLLGDWLSVQYNGFLHGIIIPLTLCYYHPWGATELNTMKSLVLAAYVPT